MSFVPKSRLEKILCGVATTARTRIEKAVTVAMDQTVEVAGTLGQNAEENITITLDKAVEELYAALSAGKKLKIVVPLDANSTVEFVATIDAYRIEEAGVFSYIFRFVNQEGTAFVSDSLSEDDAVVLVEQ